MPSILKLLGLSALATTTLAAIPSHSGYRVVWSDDFNGGANSPVSAANWDVMARTSDENQNGEWQDYRASTANVRLAGDGSLQIIPRRDSSATRGWTSGRITSKQAWACPRGSAMMFEAEILVPNFTGSPAIFDGLWPAFWARGKTVTGSRPHEWDVLEPTNWLGGDNQAALHYADVNKNMQIIKKKVPYKGGDWHVWAVKSDRRNADWKQQKLTWYLNGSPWLEFKGSDFGVESVWRDIAWNPFEIILNVAIGGGHPGNPTSATLDGLSSAMRVKYVAVYLSD
ncbi:uncharacterized protein PpBr36_10250 [Pyricularia pennisetigena]|uniref:uncharacterized protein n=1 Tax=Pyricularia pennisetigena TaxID=1578925 RepID=UPI00115451F1|nr:uncharacterized protein PpBr36_10250 [Pyricularia pennisetigena]TLS21544.1 hypothetical protein PpBr36_10250 [Pyricularia pennisetigena]